MKKIMMTMAAALIMTSAAMAQNENKDNTTKLSRTERIQKRTDATVKRYNLNEEQAKKLLELNTKYDGKMGSQRMARGGRPGMDRGAMRADSSAVRAHKGTMRARTDVPMTDRKAPEGMRRKAEGDTTMVRRIAPARGGLKNTAETMQAYDKELQTIMTPEQYKQYKEDAQKRMSRNVHTFKNKNNNTEK